MTAGRRRTREARRSDASRREVERFAHAAEIGHDPEFADELAVVSALRGLGTSPALDEVTRARIARRATAAPHRTPSSCPE